MKGGARRRSTAGGAGSESTASHSSSASSKRSSGTVDVASLSAQQAWQVPARTLVACLVVPVLAALVRVGSMDRWIGTQLATCSLLSVLAYFATVAMVPRVAGKLKGKLSGVDIGRRGLGGPEDGKPIPESLGIVSSTVFMMCVGAMMFLFGKQNDQVLEYNAALLSICFATLLGLVDDVIDIKWKHKLVIGVVMSMPLLVSYQGPTSILIPRVMAEYIQTEPTLIEIINAIPSVHIHPSGNFVDLGVLFYMYMAALIVFCTNAINIYAGINGIEVGQSVVIAGSISMLNLFSLIWRGGTEEEILSGDGRNHLFSLTIMLPFLATSLGLLRYNFYPAQVFVGDVFPYYAGMTIATSAILGHFSKSLLFLMIPQVINFCYSAPQLFHLVPIPRHRLPRVDLATGWMHPSHVAPDDPRCNMTLLCLALRIFGPMHERTLCVVLLVFQVACGVIGYYFRNSISEWMF